MLGAAVGGLEVASESEPISGVMMAIVSMLTRLRITNPPFFMRGNIGAGIFDTISIRPKRPSRGFTALSQKRFYV